MRNIPSATVSPSLTAHSELFVLRDDTGYYWVGIAQELQGALLVGSTYTLSHYYKVISNTWPDQAKCEISLTYTHDSLQQPDDGTSNDVLLLKQPLSAGTTDWVKITAPVKLTSQASWIGSHVFCDNSDLYKGQIIVLVDNFRLLEPVS